MSHSFFFVSTFNTYKVQQYDGETGKFIGTFASRSSSPPICLPGGLTMTPDGYVLVTDRRENDIYKYSLDGKGSIFNYGDSQRLVEPVNLLFGSDGNLYVSSGRTNQVLKYNGTTGQYLGIFADGDPVGLEGPVGLAFDASGNLYVSSYYDSQVFKFDSKGNFLKSFTSPELKSPTGLVFNPDKNLVYVNSFLTHKIIAFDTEGNYVDTVANVPGPVAAILVGKDLFVCSTDTNVQPRQGKILRITPQGDIEKFISEGLENTSAEGIAFYSRAKKQKD